MNHRVITIELRSYCTALEAQILRDAALEAAWKKAYEELHVTLAASTRIETPVSLADV